ncbi:hypothetical protein [Pontibacillus litoralis]|uniref:Uncharacterized protein n=1 Tax=Pontibacillus litoralis JSM 072002 TaxID=1385512 RepID=A0A0A5G4J4_9BACI|nr:hypothetical protein [Pontibacillus litoralis]KGX88021.1 hypothetical protein N784_12565 [Pontibacillus litoralis JSM 072002]
MARGKAFQSKRKNHENEKPLEAKRFAEVGEDKADSMHTKRGGAIKE